MEPVHVGLVADPAKPTKAARRMEDLGPPGGRDRRGWDVDVVSEPFTHASEEVDAAFSRLEEHAREQGWDVVVGLTELPLRGDDERYLLVEADRERRVAVLSLPALAGLRTHGRIRRAVRELVSGLADPTRRNDDCRVRLPRRSGHWRVLLGMVLANQPWRLVAGAQVGPRRGADHRCDRHA